MEITYNAIGARRKELVKAVAAILGAKPVYLGTPSFAYQVGDIEVTRDGALRLPDGMAAQPLTEALAKAGFHYEGEDAMKTATQEDGGADGAAHCGRDRVGQPSGNHAILPAGPPGGRNAEHPGHCRAQGGNLLRPGSNPNADSGA